MTPAGAGEHGQHHGRRGDLGLPLLPQIADDGRESDSYLLPAQSRQSAQIGDDPRAERYRHLPMLLVYEYDAGAGRVVILTIQDARSSSAATSG